LLLKETTFAEVAPFIGESGSYFNTPKFPLGDTHEIYVFLSPLFELYKARSVTKCTVGTCLKYIGL
jgi:hypothetical protein